MTTYIKLPILLRRVFLSDFPAWAKRDGAIRAVLGGQVLEVELAARRLKHIVASTTPRSEDFCAPLAHREKGCSRRKLNAEQTQRILFLSRELSVADLARRFAMGQATIQRILRANARSNHVPVSTVLNGHKQSERRRFRI